MRDLEGRFDRNFRHIERRKGRVNLAPHPTTNPFRYFPLYMTAWMWTKLQIYFVPVAR